MDDATRICKEASDLVRIVDRCGNRADRKRIVDVGRERVRRDIEGVAVAVSVAVIIEADREITVVHADQLVFGYHARVARARDTAVGGLGVVDHGERPALLVEAELEIDGHPVVCGIRVPRPRPDVV